MLWELLAIAVLGISLGNGLKYDPPKIRDEHFHKNFNRIVDRVRGKCEQDVVKHSGSVVSNGHECAAIGG